MSHRRRLWTLLVAALFVFAGLGATLPSRAQESTPDAELPEIDVTRTTREESTPEAEEEAPAEETSDEEGDEGELAVDEGDEGEESVIEGDIVPGQELVIAQGLAIYDEFDEGKWWLTELEPLGADEAGSNEAPAFGFLLQLEGATIIRNDLTGKRARIEPGEAYYFSQGDPYTRYADGEGSRAWLLEIVPDDREEEDAAGDVRYQSDTFEDLPDAVRDFELTAGTLAQGESLDIESGDAPSLVVLVSGRLTVDDGRVLNTPASFAFPESTTLTNEESADAQYYVATLSSDVISDEAPAPAEVDADADDTADDADADADGTPAADDADEAAADPDTTTDAGDLDSDGDGVADDIEVDIGSDPADIDTDNDGLLDGEEVSFTSVLFPDSDGDGFDDYAEVVTFGTDPNDPNDFPQE